MPELTNPRAERVKAVRALSGRSVRARTGRFLAEGPQAVREAVRERDLRVRDLYVTAESEARHPEIVETARSRGVRVHRGTPEVLAAMSPDAQQVVAVVDIRPPDLAAVLSTAPRLVAILAHVRDPGNAGAVIRAADAAGADAVLLTVESVDVHNPKVVRSTAGSLFHLPVVTGLSLPGALDAVRSAGLAVLAADGTGEHDLDDLLDRAGTDGSGAPDGPDLSRPTAWVFGNEAWGLTAPHRSLADAVVRVPIRGRAESLNLATAATVCLYASSRAQR
ncbi:RNA methyltransferase [Actinotalea sp. K2]|uniref:TrmH family RNA methyltransferase n=1 Tax=Actinotalea sp. K2 TaxID=2939438 RepID=UPI0020182A51|nr:RNA methyltransferase [Actinotalea sp. K2]MCL3860090.1 RNA methyltransferase [Actinotalea sp. K2]